MANALQLKTLNEITTQYAQLNGLPPHKAFLYFVIERFLQKLELNSIDIEESIVDGSDDCGIDAIVIDEDSEFRPRIYFFQSKYYQTEDAFNKQFEGNALEKIQGAIILKLAFLFLFGNYNRIINLGFSKQGFLNRRR